MNKAGIDEFNRLQAKSTPRKLTADDIGKKFRPSAWGDRMPGFFKLLAITSNGSLVGEDADGDSDFETGNTLWFPYTESTLPKKKVMMAPVVYRLNDNIAVSTIVYPSLERAKAWYSHEFIDWPAKDKDGNELWYQVPVEEL